MKNLIKIKSKQLQILVFAILSVFAFNSCKVTLIPNYDATIAKQIEKTTKQVDKFYLTMLETTTENNNGRIFEKFSKQYVDIEVELNSLLNQNKVRPLNENSTRICEITLKLWQKYKEEHKKDNTLSNGLIKLNLKSFSDLFFAMQVAEKAKEIVNKHPQ
ncbi:MAG: hypothetical protein IIC75_04440 [Bacteroidetes bacterium]|nr:hypothetical protein [Bacteroidota bacterium]